ncbi:DUF167 domain-containing protein [Comamonas flocculans]|uniref:UPF0235 protein FOZ74_14765 n=1 Tax=Comamonas flocculans TaxID=2597701 RepID=A0A5B8RX33_9BURK|nr:DUF167 domain-containing protein [Comamonas flocculans]QEA14189.1 DUF167 domain-containing protein [Comamonas flocculans]
MPPTLMLSIHATPGARRTGPAGAHGAALRVCLAAPPVDGKANAALLAWAAQVFGLPRARVRLLAGAAARRKRLGLEFASEQELARAREQVAVWMRQGGADEIFKE